MVSRFYVSENYCQYGEDLFELSVIPVGCTLAIFIDLIDKMDKETRYQPKTERFLVGRLCVGVALGAPTNVGMFRLHMCRPFSLYVRSIIHFMVKVPERRISSKPMFSLAGLVSLFLRREVPFCFYGFLYPILQVPKY